ncbi:MAG TPA: hypothetical protein VE669_02220, partial [Actinomycetota bacterium]|nr:hypothetical protein [Actinomycetota bacterium]
MSPRTGKVAGWSLLTLSFALTVVGLVLVLGAPEPARELQSAFESYVTPTAIAGFGVATLAFSSVGALILSRRPRNGIGWLFA